VKANHGGAFGGTRAKGKCDERPADAGRGPRQRGGKPRGCAPRRPALVSKDATRVALALWTPRPWIPGGWPPTQTHPRLILARERASRA